MRTHLHVRYLHRRDHNLLDQSISPEPNVCVRFGIGRDDLFNTIFTLAHARRYGLSSGDIADLLEGATTLAEFAHRESVRSGNGGHAPEQRKQLLLEGCHAAVREDDTLHFARFVESIELDPDTVHPAFRRSQRDFVAEILLIARPQIRRREDWVNAVSKLNYVYDYLRT